MKLMSLRERLSRATAVLVCLAVLLSASVTTTAFAYERIDTAKMTSLTATFAENGVGMKGVEFRLYRVADVSDAAEFTLAGNFKGAPVSLNAIKNSSDWANMAVTLSGYASANKISPDLTGTTDAKGNVTFSGLTVGLYLLVGDAVVVGDYSYSPAPSIIMLPTLRNDDIWEYAPSVTVKQEKTLVNEYQNVTVKKVWSDGNRSARPDSVKMQLLRDGQVKETVTLNANNNWTYTWKDLKSTYEGQNGKKTHTYTVSETSVPTGYTMSVSQNNGVFTVTNTYKTTADTTPTKPSRDSTLPKTGTLNWPIPVLTISGLLLAGLGWYLFIRKEGN